MRPTILLVIVTIFIFSIRVDLTEGTIPFKDLAQNNEIVEQDEEDVSTVNSDVAFQEVIVEPGQTVYGIVMELHQPNAFNIPIHQVLDDFEALNNEVSAHKLFAGETYKFPLYETTATETS